MCGCNFSKIKAFQTFCLFFSPVPASWYLHQPSFPLCPVGLRISLSERKIPCIYSNLKTLYRDELPYISAKIAVSSFTYLYDCDLKANQMTVAVSQAEFGLCNVVFDWALVRERKNPLNTHKADDPALFPKHPSALLFSHPAYLLLLCPYLTFSPVVYSLSHFQLLSLSSCHRGKQVLLLWKLLSERREAAYETSSMETEAYIWPFPVCGTGGR